MARHDCLPATLTVENLAVWLTENNAGEVTHIEKTPLDDEKVHELESASSLASRAIDRLEQIKKEFLEVLKGGTPDEEEPWDTTIPPTKGLKILKANRAFADKQLEQGNSEDTVIIYMIPWPEMSMMVGADITGEEWPQFTRGMNPEEINAHMPLLKGGKKEKKEKKAKAEQLDFLQEEETDSPLDL